MRKNRYLLLLVVFISLSSCAPKYTAKQDSWTHMYGYEDSPIDGTTYQVSYIGDAATPSETVNRFALFRCAELTVEKAYDYFIIMDGTAQTNTQTTTMSDLPTHHTTIEHDIDPQT